MDEAGIRRALLGLPEASLERLLHDLLTDPAFQHVTQRVLHRVAERRGSLMGRAAPVGGMGRGGEPIARG